MKKKAKSKVVKVNRVRKASCIKMKKVKAHLKDDMKTFSREKAEDKKLLKKLKKK